MVGKLTAEGTMTVKAKATTASTAPAEEPIFASAHAALKFALNFTHGTLKKNVLAKVQGGSSSGLGLAGLDGAAQAGMILGEIERLGAPRSKIIVARFAVPVEPCACRAPCCSGSRETDHWADAVNWLTEFVLVQGLTGSVSHYRLRRGLVARYFGRRESFVDLAQRCGVNRDTASAYNKRIHEAFVAEEKAAFQEIERRLKASGVVAS